MAVKDEVSPQPRGRSRIDHNFSNTRSLLRLYTVHSLVPYVGTLFAASAINTALVRTA